VTEDRRYTDMRMNIMEKDIRELRAEQKTIAEDVTAIREKIFNGFDKTVTETHNEVVELRKLHDTVSALSKSDTNEYRLVTCPLREDIAKKIERKIYLAIAILSIVITVASFAGTIIGG